MLLISSALFGGHVTPPGHPETPERAGVFNAAALKWVQNGGRAVEPAGATDTELAWAHTAAHLARIEATTGSAAMLDPDTFTSPQSASVARLAAGGAVQAIEYALVHSEPALALVRPPGHHAERDRAMGFCLYNNVAVAAYAALDRGVQRVAIVDIDVHHGNGTQQIFYDDPRVLYVSTHQFPFYPGTGAVEEVGCGEGTGFSVNVPLESGSGDADYDLAYRAIVEPVLDQFAPVLTIVSAGFDAHERDPLASMRVTTQGYAEVVRRLRDVSSRHGSALALVTEGGYDLAALSACLEASCGVLSDVPGPSTGISGAPQPQREDSMALRGERAVRAARAANAGFWRF